MKMEKFTPCHPSSLCLRSPSPPFTRRATAQKSRAVARLEVGNEVLRVEGETHEASLKEEKRPNAPQIEPPLHTLQRRTARTLNGREAPSREKFSSLSVKVAVSTLAFGVTVEATVPSSMK